MINEADFERRVLAADWSAYEQPGFGSIPRAILGLAQATPGERSAWQDALELCLLPQASLGDGTPYAIPLLLDLLRERIASEEILYVLMLIAICTEDRSSGDLGVQCRQGLRSGLNVLVGCLLDAELPTAVRSLALDVICRLVENRCAWEPILRRLSDSDIDSELRSEIREWLE
ncbi:MAG: hypothetical protein U0271_15585 [Polyangiaceae bacterium]